MFKIKVHVSWCAWQGSVEKAGGVYELVASSKEELKSLLLRMTEEDYEVRFDGDKKVSKETIEQTEEKMREINHYSAWRRSELWIVQQSPGVNYFL